jgi:hypothetical protein
MWWYYDDARWCNRERQGGSWSNNPWSSLCLWLISLGGCRNDVFDSSVGKKPDPEEEKRYSNGGCKRFRILKSVKCINYRLRRRLRWLELLNEWQNRQVLSWQVFGRRKEESMESKRGSFEGESVGGS